MFSHIMLGANDIQESKTFYDATLKELGYEAGTIDKKGRCFYTTESGVFAITKPINGEEASHGNGSTIGFLAKTPEAVDAWHAAGQANGGVTCESSPRAQDGTVSSMYIAYLRDPAGNKLCALHRFA